MKHEDYKELVQLSVYDEISLEDKKLLEDHLLECEECSKEYESIKQLYVAIAENAPKNISDTVLSESRGELFSSIAGDTKESSLLQKFIDLFEELLFGRYAFAAGGVTALFIGLFLGRVMFIPDLAENPQNNSINLDELIGGDVNISNIRLPNNWNDKEKIEVNFDAVRSVNLTADLHDPIIKTILAKSILESENSWNRIQTLNKISDQKNSNTLINNPKIKRALLIAATQDQNPAVRKEALKSIEMIEYDKDVRDALVLVLLNDTNPGMRIAAINLIAKNNSETGKMDIELKSILDNRKNNDQNSFVKLKAASMLETN
ncbi:MAG: HEAT repeat domain-containing protein [Melioribacteraceae bacterium]|nr:HEAT repeat domain-containing protein [Melioribacteraceae bacterium]